MTCQQRNSGLLQSFIHLMNDFSVRSEIIDYHLVNTKKKRQYQWIGTWVVEKDNRHLRFIEQDPIFSTKTNKYIEDLLEKKKHTLMKIPFTMFTVCIRYEGNLVHYVAFVYDSQNKSLVSFDPGVELYHHGQKTIVPMVHKAFQQKGLLKKYLILGSCHQFSFKKKKLGIQFNGKTKTSLPADAFCQSWTIFFLVKLLYTSDLEQAKTMLSRWCSIHPKDREHFITSFFILPTLMYFPNAATQYSAMTGHEKIDAIQQISYPVEKCFFSKNKISVVQ